jgi:hypothetical protein
MLVYMAVETVQLKRETLQAFEDYITRVDEAVAKELNGDQCFLWTDGDAQRSRDAHAGALVVEPWHDRGSHSPFAVPHGLIHDLVGAAFIPRKTVQDVLRLIQDYDKHKDIYQPEVIDSKLLKRSGNDFQIYLRLLKKKIITVVLDTYHDVHYGSAGASRAWCRSQTTKVLEVEDAGTPNERRSAPDAGFGFLWRLYSYWRFEAKDGGVFIECRAISLTRDIPLVLKLVIKPIVQSLPKESLENTLAATRAAVLARRS